MVSGALGTAIGPLPSIEALLCDEELRRRLFPIAKSKIYLAHAAVAPLPAPVRDAIAAYVRHASEEGQFEYLHSGAESESRLLAAKIIGADAAEIAFVPSTSAGLSLVAQGLDWRPGDSVVAFEGDFPSNVYPWRKLGARNVELRLIPVNPNGVVSVESVLAHVDASTRLVSLSTVHHTTGAAIDVEAIGNALKTRGVLLCLDAIQSLGTVPTPARFADFLVADAHKWLLGPQGIAVMYVSQRCFACLEPALVGWKSVKYPRNFNGAEFELSETARRYEPGSLNVVGLIGLHAALQILLAIGLEATYARLTEIGTRLRSELQWQGYEVVGSESDVAGSPIVSFLGELSSELLARRLDTADCIVSVRDDPLGRSCVRISPHFYTTDAEIEKLLALTKSVNAQK